MVKIEHLQKNTSYNVNASIFTGNFEYWHLMSTKSFKTLETENYWPQMILNDTITVDYVPQNDSQALIAKIDWQPTAGELIQFNSLNIYSHKLHILLTQQHWCDDANSIHFQI